ncbi:MAG TPA: dihydrofolate reductase [Candidatus Saccharimonadales bacterium]|nr:dihydrofolate reductase [Candidatus Saccharimonadales bacterium]
MIRFIAAIDSKRGLANANGIPWQGKIPTDVAQFRQKTLHGNLMMGYGWYQEQKEPLPDRRNFVAFPDEEVMRPGFEQVKDARKFLQEFQEDIWVGGGALLFEDTLDLADELYITQLDQDFQCTKFFPEFHDKFELVSQTEPQTESDITFTFQVWKKNS